MITTSKVILLSAFLLSVVTLLMCAPIPIITIGSQPQDEESELTSYDAVPENENYGVLHQKIPVHEFLDNVQNRIELKHEVNYEPHRGQMYTPNVGSSHWTNDYKLGMRAMNKLFEEGERFDQKINYIVDKKSAFLNGNNGLKVFMIPDIGPDSNLVSNIDTHDRPDSEQNVKNITDNRKILTERIFSLPLKNGFSKSFDGFKSSNVFHMNQAMESGNKILKGLLDEIKFGNILSKADPIEFEDPYRDTLFDTAIPHNKVPNKSGYKNKEKVNSDNFIDINVKDIDSTHENRGKPKYLLDESDSSQIFDEDEDGGGYNRDAVSKASQTGADTSGDAVKNEVGRNIKSDEDTTEDENEDDDDKKDTDESDEDKSDDAEADENSEGETSEESSERDEITGEKQAEEVNRSGKEDEDDMIQLKIGGQGLGMGVVDEENYKQGYDGDNSDDDDDDDDGGGSGYGNGKGKGKGNGGDGGNGYGDGDDEEEEEGEEEEEDEDELEEDENEDAYGNEEENGDDDDDDTDEEEGEGSLSKPKVTTIKVQLGNGVHGNKTSVTKNVKMKGRENGKESHKGNRMKIKAKLTEHKSKAAKSKPKYKKIKFAVKIKHHKGKEDEEEEGGEEEEEGYGGGSNGDDDYNDDDDDETSNEEEDEDEKNSEDGYGADENSDDDDDDDDDDDEEGEDESDGDDDNGDGGDKCKTGKTKHSTKHPCASDGDISLPTVSDRDEEVNDNEDNNEDDTDNEDEKSSPRNGYEDTKENTMSAKNKKNAWLANRKKKKHKAEKKKSQLPFKVHHTTKGFKHHISITEKESKSKPKGKIHRHKHVAHVNIPAKSFTPLKEESYAKPPQSSEAAPEMPKPLFIANITITNSSAGLKNHIETVENVELTQSAKKGYNKPPAPDSGRVESSMMPMKISMNISKQIETVAQEEKGDVDKEFDPSGTEVFINQMKNVYGDDDNFIMFLMKILTKELKLRLSKN